jgi:hypothetical protein
MHAVMLILLLVIAALLIWLLTKADAVPFSGRYRSPRDDEVEADKKFPKEIVWLLDAPLFIDGERVEAFYDSVLRPDFEAASLTLSRSLQQGATLGAELKVDTAIPWLASGGAGLTGALTAEEGRSTETGFTPVVNPFRHLLALSLHYADNLPERLVLSGDKNTFVDGNQRPLDTRWTESAFATESPKALLMINLPAGTEFIPTALQLSEKAPVLLFDDLGKAFAKGSPVPQYPGSRSDRAERDRYWQWFIDRYDDREALRVVENASNGGAIEWIDFRVPVAKPTVFLHLHCRPRAKYESGVFAYPFISRGYKHGLRVVGTLKSEPDLDVLAVYER